MGQHAQSQVHRSSVGRLFVGVLFACCQVYARVYRGRDGRAYEGCCPRCLKRVRLPIGPAGTSARFFLAE